MSTYHQAIINLLPVIIGGAIGIIGSVGGGIFLHLLRTRTEAKIHRRDKLEKLVSLAYEARHWIQVNSVAELSGKQPETKMLPTAEMRMISLLYLPELRQEVIDLNDYIVSYHIWTMEQGFKRKQEGHLGPETLQQHEERGGKVRELVGKLEKKAEGLASHKSRPFGF